MLAVNVPRSATERAPAFGLRQQVDGVADDVVPALPRRFAAAMCW